MNRDFITLYVDILRHKCEYADRGGILYFKTSLSKWLLSNHADSLAKYCLRKI